VASARKFVEDLLAKADIKIGGDRPWDIVVHDEHFFNRAVAEGSLGIGEAYMDGWWDSPALDQFFTRAFSAKLREHFTSSLPEYLMAIKSRFMNLQSKARAHLVAEAHYDLGNDLYEAMLDRRMIYTCAYWKDAVDLDTAQEAKLDLICRKLGLKSSDRVLDIGCGWGGFAKYAAEKYGASVVGITVSKEQLALAQERCKGLPIELRLQDYRELQETFDHIVSIEMFEAVGYKNFRTYFEVAARCLKDEGLFVLQTIGSQYSTKTYDPWLDKYIFPNGLLPSMAQIGKAVEKLFVIEDVQNIGADYAPTLMAWFERFDAAWPSLKAKYGDRFYRMWKFYLLMCAGLFRSRGANDWQFVFSKGGVPGGYTPVRQYMNEGSPRVARRAL
jgi:cyclopropane-fatty-acyl-phospholipid synthase